LAFDEYAKVFVEGYSTIKQEVIRRITEEINDNNLTVADDLKQPKSIIDQILNLLWEKGLITISRRLGGKVVVKTKSPISNV